MHLDEETTGTAGRPAPESEPPPVRRRPLAAGRVLIVMLVCFLVWLLVDAHTIQREAQASPIGARRSASLTFMGPFGAISSWLGLGRLNSTVQSAFGNGGGAGAGSAPPTRIVIPHPRRTGPPPSVNAPLPLLAAPTAADPMKVLVVGDSIGEDFGLGLSRVMGSPRYKVIVDAHISTGLARPDYFNWPAQLAADLVKYRPDVVCVMLGGNDNQGFVTNGRAYLFGTASWHREYQRRVREFADEALQVAQRVVWIGMPVMQNPNMSHQMAMLNSIYQKVVGRTSGATYVDSWNLFVNRSGGYTAYLPDANGNLQQVREGDGVHLTADGADRLGTFVQGVIRGMTARPSPERPAAPPESPSAPASPASGTSPGNMGAR